MRESEHVEPPFAPALVEELLRLVVKAARAQQLYLPNNPIYRGAIDTLRAGFGPIWAQTDELTLAIAETEIRWCDAVVAGETGKSADSLAWLFYKDGVRELRLAKGFEENEALAFLKLVQRARIASPDEDDLVTMLWESDFSFLQYKYVDLLQEGGGGDELTDGSAAPAGGAPPSAEDVQRATRAAVAESQAPGFVNMADFDATLYFLDDREIEYIQGELAREYEQDLRANILAVLLDIFEQQTDPDVRGEVLEDVQTLLIHVLATGHFRGVANLLREAAIAAERAPSVTPDQQRLLAQLPDRLSADEALTQLLQALDDAPVLPAPDELAALFAQLRPAALATVFRWLGKIRNERLRSLLEGAAERLAAANTAELVRLVQSPDADVANEAIRRAGALKAQAAVLALSKLFGDPDATRRQLVVAALAEIASPGALQALERAIEDADRDVRVAAVRALGGHLHRPALVRLEATMNGKSLRDADLTEKMAFFEAYGALCGDAGVAYLDALLNGKGFLGRREEPETRACAAMALGRVNTPAAHESLRKAAAEKDVVVRSAVSRALRGTGDTGAAR